MLSCRESERLLARAADDGLAAADRAAVEAHLGTCAACRNELASQRLVRAALASRPPADLPAGFEARLRARLDAPPSMLDLGHWRRWTFRLVPVAAALALVAGLVASRLAVETPAADLSGLVDRWTTAMPMGARGTGDEPASALLWRSETTDQALLLAVLTAGPDATAGDYLQENGDGR